jgi:hypothetical protein
VAWADGIDPKVIIQKGGGSTPITLTNPNPSVTATSHANTEANPCFLASSSACISDVFQNRTGKTLTSLDIFIPAVQNLFFTCGDISDLLFFDHCTSAIGHGGTSIFFSADGMHGFDGVTPAIFQCVPDLDGDDDGGKKGCNEDDFAWVGGEFAVDIEGSDLPPRTRITTQVITSPEPGSSMLILFGALAFGLFKVVRRAV